MHIQTANNTIVVKDDLVLVQTPEVLVAYGTGGLQHQVLILSHILLVEARQLVLDDFENLLDLRSLDLIGLDQVVRTYQQVVGRSRASLGAQCHGLGAIGGRLEQDGSLGGDGTLQSGQRGYTLSAHLGHRVGGNALGQRVSKVGVERGHILAIVLVGLGEVDGEVGAGLKPSRFSSDQMVRGSLSMMSLLPSLMKSGLPSFCTM